MTQAAEFEADLIERAKVGESDAFDELRRRHLRAVRGFIRARARNHEDTDDIEQETWLNVWTHMTHYDPARAPFEAFAKYRAWIALVRFYAHTWHAVVLFSSLIERFPDIENPSEIVDLIAGPDSLWTQPVVEAEESARELLERYDRALRLTFKDPIPPHHYLAFGFVRLLGWKPAALADAHGATPLRRLAEKFETDYVTESQLPPARVRPTFAPLRDSMTARLGEVVREKKTRAAHQDLLQRVVGETALRDYAHTPLDVSISSWWFAVTRRAGKELAKAPASTMFRRRVVRPAS